MANDRSKLIFSAHSLQAFVDCERRFELQYIDELTWPAVETEPVLKSERYMADGRRFHEMIQREVLDIPVPDPDPMKDPDVAAWWLRFQEHRPADGPGERFAEKTLVGSVDGATLVATYDLIVREPGGRTRIFDWKTWRHPPDRAAVQEKLQTRVYPYLLARAGGMFFASAPIQPAQIEMIYWYAEKPDAPEVFPYSEAQFREDEAYLQGLIADILQREAGAFPLTEDHRLCKYCPYRSFCGRGAEAGAFEDLQLEEAFEPPSLLGSLDDYEAIAF